MRPHGLASLDCRCSLRTILVESTINPPTVVRVAKPTLPRIILLHSLLTFVLVGLSLSAHGLNQSKDISQYVHKDWNNIDGLPQNTVTSIAQTANGYLWLGTLEGLVRFDGARFTLFNTRNTPAFAHNMVVELLVDRQDRLWVATSGGGMLVMRHGEFVQLTTKQGLPSDQVSAIFEDARGKIWIGTDGGGLVAMVDGQVIVDESISKLATSIRAITESKTGLWVGTEAGLLLLQADGTHTRFGSQDGLSDQSVRALLSDHRGVLWVSTDTGLDKLELGHFTAIEGASVRGEGMILAMLEDRDNNLWLATDGGGLKRLRSGVISSSPAEDGLSGDSILALYESADGSLWIGTNLGGLNQLKDGRISSYTSEQGLTHNFIRAVHEDKQGILWIGTEGGGLLKYQQGQFQSIPTANGSSNYTVYSMLENRRSELWLGTNRGIARLRDGAVELLEEQSGLSDNIVLALLEDSAGTLWAGTYAGGLNQFKDGTFTALTIEDGLGSNTINSILEDRTGALWIATRGGGLSRLANGNLRTFTTADGLSDDLVFALHEDEAGSIWIGTYGGGLNRFRNGQFTIINESSGLFDDVIHRIIDDGQGNFWMSSNRGIFSVTKAELNAVADGIRDRVRSIVFGNRDGMKNVECNGGANAGTLSRDGSIWFPSVEGLLRVYPQVNDDRNEAAKVLVEEVLVDHRMLEKADSLDLDADFNNLELHYTATDLYSPEKLRFRYRMQGYDDQWVNAGGRRTAYYSNLPAGEYEFQVLADYGRGNWSVSGLGLSLSVAPRFYETLWFRSAAFLGLILLVYGAIRVRMNQLSHRTQRLEEVVMQRTAELESANKQLSQLAGEDGLTGLLNRRSFDAALIEECRRAARLKTSLALLLLDIDNFKQFNQIYGQQEGDESLRKIASTLNEACNRAGESVSRYGGGEFSIILPATTQQGAMQHAQTLRLLIERLAIPHSGSDIATNLTTSIGVACMVPNAKTQAKTLLMAADKALKEAKQLGRNQVEAAGVVQEGVD
jgi:diguanylate cyclase (GGDEF)-like protein